jgi:hypothetical protein
MVLIQVSKGVDFHIHSSLFPAFYLVLACQQKKNNQHNIPVSTV